MFLTVAWVPTGMKTGVRTSPWRVVKRAARARVPGAVFSSVKARRDMAVGERREVDAKNKRKFTRVLSDCGGCGVGKSRKYEHGEPGKALVKRGCTGLGFGGDGKGGGSGNRGVGREGAVSG